MECEIAIGRHAGKRVLIPRIPITPSDSNLPFQFTRVQFPLQLSFAMSINKAQGQTMKTVGLHLVTPVFSHGQLYVALSRAMSRENIHVLLEKGEYTTQNVVYKQVLLAN